MHIVDYLALRSSGFCSFSCTNVQEDWKVLDTPGSQGSADKKNLVYPSVLYA